MSLKLLARDLGISKTTVSRALNGYPEVGARTRERVLAAAKAAGYQPNPLALSLALGRTNTIGIVHPLDCDGAMDPIFGRVVAGVSARLEQQGRKLIIMPVSAENELGAYRHMVRGGQVDGLIVSRTAVHDARIAYLAESGFPFIAHGRTAMAQPHAWFDYDHAAGTRMALRHLLLHGHTRIGMIGAPLPLNFAFSRHAAFEACMREAGLPVEPRHVAQGAIDRRTGYRAMQSLLSQSPRPSAVIIDNHLSGVGAVRALLDAGVDVGSEVSVIVWGRTDDSLLDIKVTTIDMPDPRGAGAKMAEMLLALVDGEAPENHQVMWQPVLAAGDTVKHCSAAAR